MEAYLHPTVEQPSDKFEWGQPNLEAIEEFAKKFLGWTSRKTNETILPVLKRFNDKRIQANIKNYFETQMIVQNKTTQMSKRVKKAVDRLANNDKDSEEDVEKPKKRRTKKDETVEALKSKAPRKKAVVESKPKAVRKRKSGEIGDQEEKPKAVRKVRGRKARDDEDPVKSPYFQEDVIPQKKKHEEDILQKKEKAAEILRKSKEKK